MSGTSNESVSCGQHQAQPQCDIIKLLEELPRPPPPPPPPPRPPPQTREVVTPPASGSQCWSSVEGVRPKQQRPSVLCQVSHTTSRRHHDQRPSSAGSSAAVSICKEEDDTGHQSSSPHSSSPRTSLHLLLRRDGPKQNDIKTRPHDGVAEGSSALFVSGLCRWPSCDAVTEDFSSFIKHLHAEHGHGERSIAQWRIQQDIVQYMESQLIVEKQKLIAMQRHLSEHRHLDWKAASEWQYSLPLFQPQSQVTDGDRVQQWGMKHLEELTQHGYRAAGPVHLLPDFVSSIECYKYNNIRPPYTYAYLIRWSILESPDKQRTLNEIYNWFTTMFFYFRHNTATWKNAVRHNLSLHKCFVRVEGGKGAVWTVDEREYQRRKGQKYHRDCPVKWLPSYSQYCPEDP